MFPIPTLSTYYTTSPLLSNVVSFVPDLGPGTIILGLETQVHSLQQGDFGQSTTLSLNFYIHKILKGKIFKGYIVNIK